MLKSVKFFFASLILCSAASAFALNGVNLYENPDAKSKVTNVAKSGEQLIPIFYQPKSGWIKVASPKDGSVGWVKAEDLKSPATATSIDDSAAIQQTVIADGEKAPQIYRVIQYSGPKQLSTEETKKIVAEIQKRHENMQKSLRKMQESFQKTMQDMLKNFSFGKDFYTFPILQPIIVVPDQS